MSRFKHDPRPVNDAAELVPSVLIKQVFSEISKFFAQNFRDLFLPASTPEASMEVMDKEKDARPELKNCHTVLPPERTEDAVVGNRVAVAEFKKENMSLTGPLISKPDMLSYTKIPQFSIQHIQRDETKKEIITAIYADVNGQKIVVNASNAKLIYDMARFVIEDLTEKPETPVVVLAPECDIKTPPASSAEQLTISA